MRLVVIFKDKPEMMAHRAQFGSEHLDYLESNSEEILIGGGLRHAPGSDFAGGLWVLNVKSFERAEELVKNDPYYNAELRQYEILLWGKALDKDVLL